MGRAGFWVNRRFQEESSVGDLLFWFEERGWQTVPDWQDRRTERIDFLLSLGGDGTFLEAAREAAPYEIPVIGVNYGKLGFLCEIERSGTKDALQKVIGGKYAVKERMMLMAYVKREGETRRYIALNDVVLNRPIEQSLITLRICLHGEAIASPPADGVIIATPTGSTAYSLSAGGPIISPDVEGILLTFLAPHALSARPMFVSPREEIAVTLASGEQCHVLFDGGKSLLLEQGETLYIVKAPLKAKLIHLGVRNFPQIVREKLGER